VRRTLVVIGWFFVMCACEAPYPEPVFKKQSPVKATKRTFDDALKPKVEQAAAPPRTRRPASHYAGSPDPENGEFDLNEASVGLKGEGALQAKIETSQGALNCRLFADKAPLTVANFVGLARGLRPFWDSKQSAWVKRPLYDGTTFHRVIPGFMIQGGDHLGNGTGEVGYYVPDELHPSLSHDRPGLMAMANKGPNTNGGQFFITDAATPHLTAMKTYSIFGECQPVSIVHKIANVPKAAPGSESPAEPVSIKRVTITRK
jgi:peptidyl-prolyl cis-trans isomerase A (cyclophilin A)